MSEGAPDSASRLVAVSKSARYAVVALVHLAGSEPGRLVLVEGVARRLGLPRSFLAKLFQRMARRGLLLSHRGPRGGYALARPAESVTLAEVLEAVREPDPGARDCLLRPRRCTGRELCALHGHVVAAEGALLAALRTITLAEAARGRRDACCLT